MEKDLVRRLNIIKGQVDGLSKLVDKESCDCHAVLNQFKAIDSGLKKVVELYIKKNMEFCLRTVHSKDKEVINDLIEKLIKEK
ncbi:metal-sensitive transcriptional regulator [Candidatus Parcubacteria bacterium]|nr:metal-sensitive transcriptional regulator [Candidatus Parcubacteria bacterium]